MAKFAIMGYGTLGSGLAHVAHVNHDSIMEKVGEEIRKLYSWNNEEDKLINN